MYDVECSICFNPFGINNTAMKLPCEHTVCFPCLEQIPKNFNEIFKKCPFCRRDFDLLQCKENFCIQEAALLEKAEEQAKAYPFLVCPCSKCDRKTRFGDLFCCLFCHFELMKLEKKLNFRKIQEFVMCPSCVHKHQSEHDLLNLSNCVPITVFTTTDLFSLKAEDLFAGFKENPFLASFTLDLISSVLDRQDTTDVSSELISWMASKTEDFVSSFEDLVRCNEEIRNAVLLFGRSLWSLISVLTNHSSLFGDENCIEQAFFCLQRVAPLLISAATNRGDQSFTEQAAVQEFVLDECLSVIMELWQQLLFHDNNRLSPVRTTTVKNIVSFFTDVFSLAETVEFLEIMINDEKLAIEYVASDPSTTTETQAALADYRSDLEDLLEEFYATVIEKTRLLVEEVRLRQS